MKLNRSDMAASNSLPLVTIGIPTYNRAAGYLRNAIERSLGQSYENIEVVVSDNCSTDNTTEVVQSFNDSRLHYFRQQTNIGPNKNFNFCLHQAKGDYFLLFHDDDVIDKDFVESCISALKPGQQVGVILTGVRCIDGQDNILEKHENKAKGLSPMDFVLGWYQGTTNLYLCNTLYNTAKLKEFGGFGSKKNLFDDLVPTFTLASNHGRVDVTEIKASFRRHLDNRGSNIPIQDWVEDSLFLLRILSELFKESVQVVEKGKKYLCRSMYRYISDGIALSKSPLDYLYIYKAFDYCVSPWSYFYHRKIRARIKKVIARILYPIKKIFSL